MASSDEPAAPPRADRFNLYLVVGLILGATLFFLAWKRARSPARLWAQKAEQDHAATIERALDRCFGAHTGPELRALAARVRRGEFPAPLSRCHQGPAAELMIAPNAFVASLAEPPTHVDRVKDRERQALLTLGASLRLLEQAIGHGRGNPDTAQRASIGDRIDEVAPDVDRERNALHDLAQAARDGASWF